jgi:hypothetical protein
MELVQLYLIQLQMTLHIDKVVVFDSWQSLDIPLSVFLLAKGFNPATFFQFKLGASSDIRTKLVYFDNIFFYKGSTLGVKNFTLSNIAMYPNPVSNELTIEAKIQFKKVEVFNLLGQQVLSINLKQIPKKSKQVHLVKVFMLLQPLLMMLFRLQNLLSNK